jgi:hypothetical protein
MMSLPFLMRSKRYAVNTKNSRGIAVTGVFVYAMACLPLRAFLSMELHVVHRLIAAIGSTS